MIYGLTGQLPCAAKIAGFPFGAAFYGFEEVSADEQTAMKMLAGNYIRPVNTDDNIADPASFSAVVFRNGVSKLGLGMEVLSFNQESIEHCPRIDTFTTRNTDVELAASSGIFSMPFVIIPGDDVKLTWTTPTVDDFSYANLYWDAGITVLEAAGFPILATIPSKKASMFIHQNVGAGTFRYYIRFFDRYGNGTLLNSITPVSVTTVPIPTLTGSFTFDTNAGQNRGTFTVTAQANVSQILIFANILHGYGVIDHLQLQQPYSRELSFVLPDVAHIQLAAIGFSKYGFPSVPVKANVSFFDIGEVTDRFKTPETLWTQTLAGGECFVDFTDDYGGWNKLTIAIWNYEQTDIEYSTIISAVANMRDYHVLLSPALADGNYWVQIQSAYQADESHLYVGEFSEFAPLLLDNTPPTGDATLVAEVM